MITSTTNKQVRQLVKWQTKAKERNRDGVFLIEGVKLFEEAPEENIREVYVTEDTFRRLCTDEDAKAKLKRVGWNEVTEEVFGKISDTRTPQGILCVMEQKGRDLEELLEKKDSLIVLLEDLQDPGNLGTILRTAEGAGVTGVILSRGTVDVYNPKVIRATMGSIFRVPFLYTEDLTETIGVLQARGVSVYAAHLNGKEYFSDSSFLGRTAFLIGNEGNGLKEETAKLADKYLKIPMEGKVESLNAAVATALFLYEAKRQRDIEAKIN